MEFLKILEGFKDKFVSDNETTEIQIEPDNFVILYNGDILFLRDIKPVTEEGVITHYEFALKPTLQGFIVAHKIKPEDYDPVIDAIYKKFPAQYCHQVNNHPLNTRWIIDCNWEGEPIDTEHPRLNGVRKQVTLLKNNNKTLRLQITELLQDKKRAAEIPDYYLNKTVKQLKEFKKIDEDDSNNNNKGFNTPGIIGDDPYGPV